ncbi:MAG: hypothetical protein AAF614_07780 [Chloroflexota bacterium]
MSEKTTPHKTEFRSFLVRFTKESNHSDWRIAVRNVKDGDMSACKTLHELMAVLAAEIEQKGSEG